MSVYTYSIINDIPGGFFNASTEMRLKKLIKRDITTLLDTVTINPGQQTVKLTFSQSLTLEEKTALDGNTTGPAGGLIARSNDKIQLLIDDVLKTDSSRVDIPADRITFLTIALQKADWQGNTIAGEDETVVLEPTVIGALNALDGALDSTGRFSYIVGPDVRRGSMTISNEVADFAPKALSVRFC